MTRNLGPAAVSGASASVWLDDLFRSWLSTGELAEFIDTANIVGGAGEFGWNGL